MTIAAAMFGDKCSSCNFLTSTFMRGVKETLQPKYLGGKTDWEEGTVGKFAIRFVR
jgi:hypothetical protein